MRADPREHCAVRQADSLVEAIDACCKARGDNRALRDELVAECLAMPDHFHADLREHFLDQVRLFTIGQSPTYRGAAAQEA